jgi:3'-5' exoribonuclease
MNADQSYKYLCGVNDRVQHTVLRRLNSIVLYSPLFFTSPGGVEHHHNYEHGLVIHVAEVMSNVFEMTLRHPSDELITAVIWHDYMKTCDYSMDANLIVKQPYRKLINHLSGSAMEFHAEARECLPRETLEHIEHLLLSHHGRHEWGSPVEPQTAEAFILHAADMMSAKGCNL